MSCSVEDAACICKQSAVNRRRIKQSALVESSNLVHIVFEVQCYRYTKGRRKREMFVEKKEYWAGDTGRSAGCLPSRRTLMLSWRGALPADLSTAPG